jgi:chromosome segregation ATPase
VSPWTCPNCGHNNLRDPLNARDRPACLGCGENYTTADALARKKEKELADLRLMLRGLEEKIHLLQDQAESAKCEYAAYEREIVHNQTDAAELKKEIVKWETMKVYSDVADQLTRAERARKDKYQCRFTGGAA